MGMTNQEEQALMDTLYGKSYDDRWHTVVSDMDLEEFEIEVDDYNRFCRKCGWNDLDYGCTSPSGEELWQCPMYMHYHPAEVKKFYEDIGKGSEEDRNDKRTSD